MLFSALTAISLVTGSYAAIGPQADLYIANEDIAPDSYNRSAVLAGATLDTVTFPGPLITGNKGDNFQLNVIDNLTDTTMLRSTSIHWHGIFQEGSSWADGVTGVGQCPIAPGDSFLYNFDVPDQAGTFWYHSHYSTQYCDGLRGALVIYDPNDPYLDDYDVDDESTVITLADWYHTPAPSAGLVPVSDATLINGLGRYAGGETSELAVISVESGKRYRFRLVSISCDPNFTFSIDNHTMTIIEVDGVNHEPLDVDEIQIFAGQRYSFIFTANQTVDNYWIRANPNVGTVDFDGGLNSAILRYVGASDVDPTTNLTSSNPLVETDLHPLVDPAAPGGSDAADLALNLAIALNTTAFDFTINGESWATPTVPVLLQILSGAYTAQDLLPSGSVYTLPTNSTIEISLSGGGTPGAPHPFHLHGHTFSVIRSAGSTTYNYVNPVRRDVVSVGTSTTDNVTIRFTTDNNGPWFLHCHIDWHLQLGLAIAFAENPTGITNSTIPASWDDLCPVYDALTTDEL